MAVRRAIHPVGTVEVQNCPLLSGPGLLVPWMKESIFPLPGAVRLPVKMTAVLAGGALSYMLLWQRTLEGIGLGLEFVNYPSLHHSGSGIHTTDDTFRVRFANSRPLNAL